MKKLILSIQIVSILFFIASCKESPSENKKPMESHPDQLELLSKLYNTDNLPKQTFQINPNRDTILIGQKGTVLRIYKNTFLDENGNKVTSPIDFEFKEALDPIDFVTAKLTTTSNGKLLQTGGMIYLDAKSERKSLTIDPKNPIGVMVPNEKIISDMLIFEGEMVNNEVNWVEPVPTINEDVQMLEKLKNEPKTAIVEMKVNGKPLHFDTTKVVEQKIDKSGNNPKFGKFATELSRRGENYFAVDYSTNYIFELKKLGWANIDRFYGNPNLKETELITKIENADEFDPVFITMVISDMYLTGYQMKNGNYSFTKGDYQEQTLPIGEKAIIFATAYQNNVLHFDLITTTIKEKETITLNLKKTSEEKMKKTLESRL